MLSNAFRSVCRLRNAAVIDANFASLASLGRPVDYYNGSIVEKLLLRPVVSPSDSYSPQSYSIRLDSPISSLGSPCENITDWSLEDEKSFDCKHGIYELDSLICDDLTDGFEIEEAVQSCSRVHEEIESKRVETVSNASFHTFIDDLIETVREEIEREQALEEAVQAERAAKASSDIATVAAAAARPLANKDLDAGLDGSANNFKRKAIDYSEEVVPLLRKRKRIFSLEEMALRKRNQNRRAAQRYREKLVKVKSEQLEECVELEEKNDRLRDCIANLENEIEQFKKMLLTKADDVKTEKM